MTDKIELDAAGIEAALQVHSPHLFVPLLIERVGKLTGADREVDVLIWAAIGRVDAPDDPWDYDGPLDPTWRCNGRTMHEAIAKFPNDMTGIARSWEVPEFTGSADAALALVERVLPGAMWEKYPDGGVKLWRRGQGVYEEIKGTYVSPRPLPLAIILALLKALHPLPEKASST